MYEQTDYTRVDLDTVEELNYISTVEEDEVIDAHIETLREWGYGSIAHVHDLHQLFWELTRRGVILDKLFRVAVVECIDDDSLYMKFLGMAKHYNGWAQKHKSTLAKENKQYKHALAERDSVIEMVRQKLRESQKTVGQLNSEIAVLKIAARPKSESAQMAELRQELKKEYNIKLQERLAKGKPDRQVGRALLRLLKNPDNRFFEAFDLTEEEDVKEYIEWFRLGKKKINMPTQRMIADCYEESRLQTFYALCAQYNEEWEANHQGEDAEEEDC